jgi:F0F1-type ATP synthase gamma subunit
MKLNEKEIAVLNKITKNSKMDYWFDLRFDKNGNAYVYDLEQGGKLTMKRAISDILDGLVEDYNYLDTKEERLIFENLKNRASAMKRNKLLNILQYEKKRYEDFIYDEYESDDELFLDKITALNIAINLVKKHYTED